MSREMRSCRPSSTRGRARRLLQSSHIETSTIRLQAEPPVQMFTSTQAPPAASSSLSAARRSFTRSSSRLRGMG